jgi:hypothetical protein
MNNESVVVRKCNTDYSNIQEISSYDDDSDSFAFSFDFESVCGFASGLEKYQDLHRTRRMPK